MVERSFRQHAIDEPVLEVALIAHEPDELMLDDSVGSAGRHLASATVRVRHVAVGAPDDPGIGNRRRDRVDRKLLHVSPLSDARNPFNQKPGGSGQAVLRTGTR